MDAASCRRVAERRAAWDDGSPAQAERAEIDGHLDRCEPCRQQAVLERGGRTLLRARGEALREPPLPPGLRSRCEALAARERRVPHWRRRLVPAALAAGLALFGLSTLFAFATHRSPTLLAAQLTADHLKCFRLLGPEIVAAEASEIQAVLFERFGWRLQLPGSSEDGTVELLGARRCLYADGTIPHVMYRANGQDVSLYMLNGPDTGPVDVVTLGYRSHMWSRDGLTFVVVAPDLAMAEVLQYLVQHTR
jgi:anti-sigma factor RsiW